MLFQDKATKAKSLKKKESYYKSLLMQEGLDSLLPEIKKYL